MYFCHDYNEWNHGNRDLRRVSLYMPSEILINLIKSGGDEIQIKRVCFLRFQNYLHIEDSETLPYFNTCCSDFGRFHGEFNFRIVSCKSSAGIIHQTTIPHPGCSNSSFWPPCWGYAICRHDGIQQSFFKPPDNWIQGSPDVLSAAAISNTDAVYCSNSNRNKQVDCSNSALKSQSW